jgi:hypothetical protein
MSSPVCTLLPGISIRLSVLILHFNLFPLNMLIIQSFHGLYSSSIRAKDFDR